MDEVTEKVQEALKAVGLENSPSYSLVATPKPKVQVPTLFESRAGEVVQLLKDPPSLRYAGFSQHTGAFPEIVEGKLRRALQPGFASLELWADGTMIFAADGGDDYLSWGERASRDSPLRINQIVLLESTYVFLKLISQLSKYYLPTPDQIEFQMHLRNLVSEVAPCLLGAGRVHEFSRAMEKPIRKAPRPSAKFVTMTQEIDPGKVAFDLVSQVYTWFGHDYENIPYASIDDNGQRRINEDAIRTAGKEPMFPSNE